MDINQEIRNLFAQNTNNSALRIKQLNGVYEAWVIRIDYEYGVGIAINSEIQISEHFAGAKIWSSSMSIDDKPYHLLMLTCQDDSLRMEFSAICAQFVDPGPEGEYRIELSESPLLWWDRWRKLLGNRLSDKSTHGVLGELLMLKYLINKGEEPLWTGAFGGVNDIETTLDGYEVKSSTMRYESVITITGQFQLQTETNKALSLIFCRFESSPLGQSLNDIVDELTTLGVSNGILEKGLEECGYEAGCAARFETYKLLEIRQYNVDVNFPIITLASFIDGKMPDGVLQLTYRLDLVGLPYGSLSI